MSRMDTARTVGASLAVVLGTLTIASALLLHRRGFGDSLPSALLIAEVLLGLLSGIVLLLPLPCNLEAAGMWFALTTANIYQLTLLYIFYELISSEVTTLETESARDLDPSIERRSTEDNRIQAAECTEAAASNDGRTAPLAMPNTVQPNITSIDATPRPAGEEAQGGERRLSQCSLEEELQSEHGLYAISKMLSITHAQRTELLKLPGMRELLFKFVFVRWQPLILPPLVVAIACAGLLASGSFGEWRPWCLFATNATRVAWVHSQAFLICGIYLSLLPALFRTHTRLRAVVGEERGEAEEDVWKHSMRTMLGLSQAVMRTVVLNAAARLPAAYSCTLLWAESEAAPTTEDKDTIKTASAVFLPVLSVLLPAYAYVKCDHDLRARLFCRKPPSDSENA
eukprot:CAMPEP_0181316412 /NCGR_PEP_ID=MMETSP1101-20121128/15878_1 /TAXON_ID=46948 /ORGANISM="Rhodomonas abbreviata, Strain Caron Lab Isolate" /LENGTH=398 /DNA_ID=CAMNT_0023423651 /DNA_START=135 /DNA_END=1327 /DNA_ORIENTATION=+